MKRIEFGPQLCHLGFHSAMACEPEQIAVRHLCGDPLAWCTRCGKDLTPEPAPALPEPTLSHRPHTGVRHYLDVHLLHRS